jgi:hypothetical protein
MDGSLDTEYTLGRMARYTKASIKMVVAMVKACANLVMDPVMKDLGTMGSVLDMEYLFGPMEDATKASGRMGCLMEWE